MLMTTVLAAQRLGVSHERLLDWIARKLLPIAGEDEEGRVLLREHVVLQRGEALAADAPERLRSPRLRRLWADPARPRILRCGCAFTADDRLDAEPLVYCADARALDATRRLAEALVATAPGDPFFSRLAAVSRDALASHVGGHCVPAVEALRPVSMGDEVERIVARSPSLSHGDICIRE